jgi:hypothetical protein
MNQTTLTHQSSTARVRQSRKSIMASFLLGNAQTPKADPKVGP